MMMRGNRLRLFVARLEVERSRDALRQRVLEQSLILSGLHARLDTLREAERRALARELHDELGQLLTAQRLVLESTRRRYHQTGSSIEPNLTTLEGLLDRFAVHFRSQLSALREGVQEAWDIREALRGLVERWQAHVGIECLLELPPEVLELDAERGTVLYRFLQETLTNVARHAEAQRVHIVVTEAEGWLHAEVRDDGVGLPVTPSSHPHFGLLGLRERLQPVDGTFLLESSPGQGTTVRMQFRLARAPSDPPSPSEETLR